MAELHLKQQGFTYSVCEPFTKHCEKIQKFKYRNRRLKAFIKRTISDKILKDKAYEITRNCEYDGYQRTLASLVYAFFDKKTESGKSVNGQLAEELLLCNAVIQPHFDYACPAWYPNFIEKTKRKIQINAYTFALSSTKCIICLKKSLNR